MRAKRLAVFTVFALLVLALVVFASSGTVTGDYRPQSSFSVAVPGGGVASDTSMSFTIPAPDYNYEDSSMYAFAPIDWQLATGGEIPIGAGMGTLYSLSTLGLLNGACNQTIYPLFNLYNASVDTSQQLTPAEMAWTNTSNPVPTGNYIPGLPDYLARYPHFLNIMLDPDGPAGPQLPLKPRARYAGHMKVATNWTLIEVVVLTPGQITQLPGIKAQMVPGLGYVVLAVLNNPVDQQGQPWPFSDFCTPLQTTTNLYGTTTNNPATAANEAGYTAQTNPAANTGVLGTGTHIARTYSQSERDADGDGWENDLDPCPFAANPVWDPRVTGDIMSGTCVHPGVGDHDCDGLPDVCDPAPETYDPDEDQDNDGYLNRQDICPLVANGCKDSTCSPYIYNPAWDNQADTDSTVGNADLGPKPDSIGNACDDSDNDGKENGSTVAPGTAGTGNCTDGIDNGDGDGLPDMLDPQCLVWTDQAEIAAGRTQAQIYGTNPGTGLYFHAMPWAAVCVGATDSDLDGYCDALETTLGSDPNANTSTPESLVIDASISGVGGNVNPTAMAPQSCSDGVDNDGDGWTDAADSDPLGCDPATYAGDWDYDGVANDGTDNCPAVRNPEQTDTDADGWGDACDTDDDDDGFNDDKEWYLGTDPLDNCPNVQVGPSGTYRSDAWPLDMNRSKVINLVDMLEYSGEIGLLDTDPNWSAAVQRLDLNGDGAISVVSDMWRFYHSMIASTCNGDTPHPPQVSEGAPVTMGIDPEITGNSASTLGDLEACVQVNVDPEDFDDGIADRTIDVYVAGVTAAPTGYDAWVTYPRFRVDPVSWDDLVKLPGATSFTTKMAEVARFNAAALYTGSGSGIGGDGTIVRIDLDVKSGGFACFGFGFAKAYSSPDVIHPTVARAATLAINTACTTADSDGDGVVDTCDNCRTLQNSGQEDLDYDGWGDACDYCVTTPTPWYTPPGDDDCDGFATAVEQHVGTDPLDACPDVVGADDAWPLDINMDTYVTMADVNKYYGRLGATGGPPPGSKWLQRLDLNNDNFLTMADVNKYYGRLGNHCT